LPAHYSYRWAFGVVQELKRKYARGTETVERILGITDKNLAQFLAYSDNIWPILRKLIQFCDNCKDSRGGYYTDVKVKREIRMNPFYLRHPRIIDRLDKIENEAMIREQATGGSTTEA
jgi:hypothetical protein